MTERKKIAIIGGSGKMGRWSADFLLKEGCEVVITGRNRNKLLDAGKKLNIEVATAAEAVKWADVVLLSVSLSNFEDVVKEIAPHTRSGQMIIDNASIKEFPVEVMHRYIKSGLVLGIHPMFGPSTEGISLQNFVLTPTNEEEEALAHKIQGYLEDKGARVTLMTPHQHDEMMSVILGLSHFIGLVSADTLASWDQFDQTNAISGTSYRLLLSLVKAVISEDSEFYASLQMSLPGVAGIHKLFQDKASEWAEIVKRQDQPEFINRMNTQKERLNSYL
jgi:prephenate dehydrogenase